MMVKLYVDAREVATKIPDALRAAGAEVEFVNLDVGDYVVTHETVVLRRTAHEFVSGILEERIFNQASKARLEFSRVILLVEGDIYSTGAVIRSESIDGALSHLAVTLGCSVIHHKGAYRAAAILYRMAKHAQEGRPSQTVFRRGKIAPGLGHALYSIEGFPSAGPVTTRKLLSHFGSVHKVVNATVDQLCKVQGLGPTKAARLFEGLRWDLHAEGGSVDDAVSLFAEPIHIEQ